MVGMKGGFTDGKNSRETFRDRKDSACVDNAQEQKHQMEMQMQKKRDAFDADMEKETNEKILKIQSDLATNMEKLLKKQEEQNNNEIESLKQDFKEHHSEYAKQILERVIKV